MSFLLIGILLVLFLLSAFFSSSETAVISLQKSKLEHHARSKKNKRAQYLIKLLENPEEFFSVILIGNNISNIALASVISFLATSFFQGNKSLILVIQTILTTIFIVIFGEFLPKSYAFKHNMKLALLFSIPLTLFKRLFYPMVKAFSLIYRLFLKKSKKSSFLNIEEVKHFLMTETELVQDTEALKMVTRILDFSQRDLRLIMTPRIQLAKINLLSSLKELFSLVNETGLDYLPVYKAREDNMVGIIDIKHVAKKVLQDNQESLSIENLLDKPLFVSEYSSVGYLLEEFKKSGIRAAFVLDEYGGVIGMITLSDILREYVEDISFKSVQAKSVRKNVWLADGALAIMELNSLLHSSFEEKRDFLTVSGMLTYHMGRIPEENSRIILGGYTFVVKKVQKNRVKEVVIIKNEDSNS